MAACLRSEMRHRGLMRLFQNGSPEDARLLRRAPSSTASGAAVTPGSSWLREGSACSPATGITTRTRTARGFLCAAWGTAGTTRRRQSVRVRPLAVHYAPLPLSSARLQCAPCVHRSEPGKECVCTRTPLLLWMCHGVYMCGCSSLLFAPFTRVLECAAIGRRRVITKQDKCFNVLVVRDSVTPWQKLVRRKP